MKDNTQRTPETVFAPMLYVKEVAPAIAFYEKAFGASELRRWTNPDGSVHVAEISIDAALFRLHEEAARSGELSPETLRGAPVVIGLFVTYPDAVLGIAPGAGGTESRPCRTMNMGTGREVLQTRLDITGLSRKRFHKRNDLK